MPKKEYLEGYRKYAKEYSAHTSTKLIQFQLNHFISLLPKNAKILDAGCGCGRDAAYLAEENLDVTAVDIVPELIEEAKQKSSKVNFIVKDLLNMDLKQDSFDGVWCMSSLSDIEKKDSSTLIKSFSDILKTNGILYLSAREGLGEQVIENGFFKDLPRFYAYYCQKELEELLTKHKFKILSSIISESNETKWVEVFAQKE